MSTRIAAALATVLALPTLAALAQTKAPVAQFWMDVATNSMSIPGMGDMESAEGAMFGAMFGATKMGGGAPGQWLDTALYTRLKASGTEGTHAIPPGLRMGNSLPLIPVAGGRSAEEREKAERKSRKANWCFTGAAATRYVPASHGCLISPDPAPMNGRAS